MGDVVNFPPPDQTPQTYQERARAGKLTAAEKRHAILTLRKSGKTHQEIADLLKVSKSAVTRIINRALAEFVNQDEQMIEHVRAMQLQRLDDAIAALYPAVLKGNLKAIDRLVRVEALRARIAGTEAPQRHQHDHSGSVEHNINREEVDGLQRAWLNSGGVEGSAVDITEAPAGLASGG